MEQKRRSDCPISCLLELIGDKWTMLVLRDIFFGKHHYEEFLKSPEGIATNILASRLKHLQETGLISRTQSEKDGRYARYDLTHKGLSLHPILEGMAMWGLKNLSGTKSLLTPEEIAQRKAALTEQFGKKG